METQHDFHALAASWHGGQWFPLYAFLSTGTVTEGLSGEIRSCLRMAEKHHPEDIDGLKAFLEWAEAEEAKKFPEPE